MRDTAAPAPRHPGPGLTSGSARLSINPQRRAFIWMNPFPEERFMTRRVVLSMAVLLPIAAHAQRAAPVSPTLAAFGSRRELAAYLSNVALQVPRDVPAGQPAITCPTQPAPS